MNTKIRIGLALALLAAIVIAGVGAPTWAARLSGGAPAPSAGGLAAGALAGDRPQGTVPTSGQTVTLVSDETVTVGSCATVLLQSAPKDVDYTASVVSEDALAQALPGTLLSCGIEVEASTGTTLGAEVQVCFPVPPGLAGFAYYWDGSEWVKTALESQDGQSCIDVPSTAGNPVFAALFDK